MKKPGYPWECYTGALCCQVTRGSFKEFEKLFVGFQCLDGVGGALTQPLLLFTAAAEKWISDRSQRRTQVEPSESSSCRDLCQCWGRLPGEPATAG